MSKYTYIAAIAGLFLVACQKKEIQSTEDKLTSGTWKVTSLVKNQIDQTSAYDNDVYQFKSDGSLTIAGDHNDRGYWNVNGKTDASNEQMEIYLQMEGECAKLSGTWYVATESSDMIQLVENADENTVYSMTLSKN